MNKGMCCEVIYNSDINQNVQQECLTQLLYSHDECYSEAVIIPEYTYDKINNNRKLYKNMISTMNKHAHTVLAETNTDSLCRKVSSTQTF